MTDIIRRAAEAYAKATTSARCDKMGECERCTVRNCDYRSRVEAFECGFTFAILKAKRDETVQPTGD